MAVLGALAVLVLMLALAGLGRAKDVPPVSPVPNKDQTSYLFYMTPESFAASANPYFNKIESIAKSTHINDIDQTANTSIGKIEISITNIMLEIFNMGTLQTSMDLSTNGIKGWIDDNQLSLVFDYSAQQLSFPYKSDSGTGRISTNNLALYMDLSGKKVEANGGVAISINSFEVDVGDFSIDMEGGLIANIISTVESLFSDAINEFISNVFTEFLVDYIQPMFDELSGNPLYMCDSDFFCWEYRLTQDPGYISTGLFIYFSGIAYNANHPDEMPPLEYTPLPEIATSSLLTIVFGNASFQSILNTYHLENVFSLKNPKTNIVEPITMSYDDIVSYYPEWANAYPSGTSGQYSITVSDFPKSYITYNGLKLEMVASVSLVPVGQTDTTNIASKATFTFLGDFYWIDYHDKKGVDIVTRASTLSIVASFVSVSTENSSVSNEWLTSIVSGDYLKQINKAFHDNTFTTYYLSGLIYTSPSITYHGDYVLLQADFYIED